MLYLIACGHGELDAATWAPTALAPGYLGEYTLTAALVFEFVMTFIFVTVILGATQAAGARRLWPGWPSA